MKTVFLMFFDLSQKDSTPLTQSIQKTERVEEGRRSGWPGRSDGIRL